jgi:rhamnose transport system ATP-binding protein
MTGTGASDHLVISDLVKTYGGVVALDIAELNIRRGEIHGLVGENGAGKSTLSNIIAGVISRDSGTVLLDGRAIEFHGPKEALAEGIAVITQEGAVVPKQSVLSNVFLGNESSRFGTVSKSEQLRRYYELENQVGFGLSPETQVADLAFGDQQKVEILRAIARGSGLLILDEPTASLGSTETATLFGALKRLRDHGTTIVFVSHNLEEIVGLCDTISILRDGRIIRTAAAVDETEQTLIRGMLGRPMGTVFPAKHVLAHQANEIPALRVHNLLRRGVFKDITFDLLPGEIVGLAGLVGAGRSEVARAIFGADKLDGGEVRIGGRLVYFRSPLDAARAGVAMVPESRRDQGLLFNASVSENLNIVQLRDASFFGVLNMKRIRAASDRMIRMLDIRGRDLRGSVGKLSGGNQQKVLFGKWLMKTPTILIADEPTRGVDIGAKQTLYALLAALASQGMAVLLISSELEEILGLSHRVLVMHQGSISASLRGDEISEVAIMTAAFSLDGRT